MSTISREAFGDLLPQGTQYLEAIERRLNIISSDHIRKDRTKKENQFRTMSQREEICIALALHEEMKNR